MQVPNILYITLRRRNMSKRTNRTLRAGGGAGYSVIHGVKFKEKPAKHKEFVYKGKYSREGTQ